MCALVHTQVLDVAPNVLLIQSAEIKLWSRSFLTLLNQKKNKSFTTVH